MTDTVEQLLVRARGGDETKRLDALGLLARARDGSASPALALLLSDPAPAIREAARGALIAIGGAVTVKTLIPLLETEDPVARNLAIEVLSRTGADAPEELYAVLSAGSDDARIFALDILGRLPHAPAIAAVSAMLDSDNVNVRNASVMALGRIGTAASIPHLMRALDDAEEWVRFSAIEALCRAGAGQVTAALVDKLRGASESGIYGAILECFAELRDAEAVPALIEELGAVQPRHRAAIVAVVIELLPHCASLAGANAALDGVRDAVTGEIQSADPWAAFRALELVRLLGRRDMTGIVARAAAKGPELVQAGAARALGAIATAEDLPRLEDLVATPSVEVKRELLETIVKLRGASQGG